ncbi:MAG: Gfo/Idh/MocA family oxidoreductase [Roseburia sp.]|nr:Gfo/Idh/MocA family oxidoreductase [Roseburia sp.]
MYKLGVIGLGVRIHDGVLPSFYELAGEDYRVTAVADINPEGVRERLKNNPRPGYASDLKIYTDADEMLAKEELDGVLIGTRCSLHTPMAIKVMEKNIPIFLEKPVATTFEDLKRLNEAKQKYNPRVAVSFPLRYSEIAVMVKEIIDSGKIGDVLQVVAFNDVPYGRVYFHDWYRDENETGGLWLQKATHDFDCLNYILGEKAQNVYARYTKKLFKGDMPAGLTCDACEKNKSCPESPFVIKNKYHDVVRGEYCCFAKDTGNEDCGSAVIEYQSGAVLTYTQNFFARHSAGRRGARFYGYKGTLEFDWYKSEIKVFMHNAPRVETYSFDGGGASHFGGDLKLAELYMDMLSGKSTKSYLDEGMESALMCLMARKSCETGECINIPEL